MRRHSRAVRAIQWTAMLVAVACILSKPLAIASISAYRRFVSPHKGWCCAYAVLHGGPSCPAYGKEVVARRGVFGGTLLLWNRFGDCRAAAVVLAASASRPNAGDECAAACEKSEKECAEGCVRGCCCGPPSVGPNPPPISAPRAFVPPCPDAGGYRRFGWVDPDNRDRIHLGHDYNAPAGTQVRAIADGIVVDVNLNVAGFGGSNPSKPGPLMWIRHRTSTGEFFDALYGHMKPFKSKNQWVTVGEIGGTIIPFYDGDDSIPHVHFGIWQGKNSLPTQQLGYGPKRSFVDQG